ncbi:PD-(D/E)XK nuclease family protein [bacterium]|nr:PD-(D/E)XK nuclease family protein [bacterium]
MKFLNSVVKDIIDKFSNNIDNLKVIFPIKRTKIFFDREFKNFKNYTGIIPDGEIFDEWVSKETKIATFGKVPLMFKLFDTYNEIEQPIENKLPFESFYDWGGMILNDFNMIDHYLVDYKELFSNLDKHAKIEKDDNQKELFHKYLSFWEILESLYERFDLTLSEYKGGYSGWIKKRFLNQLKEQNDIKYHYIFVGFSQLTPVEEELINILKKRGKATIYWNLDSYYIDNENQEAGVFFRDYMERNGKNISFIYNSLEKRKNINIYALSSKTAESKFTSEVLINLKNTLDEDSFYHDTAIILGDESTLPSLLNSIPDSIKNMNIALNYPFEETPLYSFIDLIIQLHEHPSQTDYEGFYYYKDVLNILTHPYFKLLTIDCERKTGKSFELYRKMIAENQTHLTFVELLNSVDVEFKNIVSAVFSNWFEVKNMLENLFKLISIFRDIFISNKKEFNLHLEYLFHFNQILQQFNYAIAYTEAKIRIRTFWNIFHEILRETYLAFTTTDYHYNDLENESRITDSLQFLNFNQFEGLDFSNLIILSANERVIPKSRKNSSFILYDTRKYFKLPTFENDDAHDAYKFYSLIQHAENISILYHTDEKNERSRFIEQLLSEDIAKISKIEEPITVSFNTELTKVNPIKEIQKNDFIFDRLKNLVFSASSLNTYLDCELKFYYETVLAIKQTEKITDSPDRASIGTIIHNILQDFYKNSLNILSSDLLKSSNKNLFKNFESNIENTYKKIGKIKDIFRGKNRTNLFAIKKMLDKVFEIERDRDSFKVLEVEKRVVFDLNLESNFIIKLKGFIDRVDQLSNGKIIIIDYKTTTKKPRQSLIPKGLDFDNWYLYPSVLEKEHFQLLLYGYLYYKNTGKKDFETAIYYISRPEDRGFSFIKSTQSGPNFVFTQDNLDKIESMITNLLNSIFDKNRGFTMLNKKKDACQNCDYFSFCGRRKEKRFLNY